jgi:PAS domain S-box-containing protein
VRPASACIMNQTAACSAPSVFVPPAPSVYRGRVSDRLLRPPGLSCVLSVLTRSRTFSLDEFQSQRGAFMNEPSKLAEKILDQVADAVICADQSGTVIRWNCACSALFGYSAEEALGQSIELIVPEHLRAAHWSGFDAAMTKGATKLAGRPTLTRAVHKSGRGCTSR